MAINFAVRNWLTLCNALQMTLFRAAMSATLPPGLDGCAK
jgi:hypothetical protein